MKYQLIIFDSDGTLADTLPWMRSIFNDLAREFGFRSVQPQDHERYRDLEGRALLKALELPLWKLPRVMNAMRKRMAEHVGEFHAFPGVPSVLRRLHDHGGRLAIVSSNSQENVERVLGGETSRLIHHYSCGVSMFGKSSKLRALLRKSGIPPAKAIYIGDEIRDGEAARDAGIAFGAATWGQHSVGALTTQKPAEIFQSPEEIAAKLA